MNRLILRTAFVVAVETTFLLLLAATWGIPGERRPAASTAKDGILTFEQSVRTVEAAPHGTLNLHADRLDR